MRTSLFFGEAQRVLQQSAMGGICSATICSLLNHLIRGSEQCRRRGNGECLRGLLKRKSVRQSHQSDGCTAPKRGSRAWRRAKQNRSEHGASSRGEESCAVVWPAEQGWLTPNGLSDSKSSAGMPRWYARCCMTISDPCVGESSRAAVRYGTPSSMA
jgi:hypothetical protein